MSDIRISLRRQIEVFTGQLTPREGLLYVRLPDIAGGGAWTLGGTVHGPHSQTGRTLPLSVPLRDLGSGPTLLARADVPDPSFWTPEVPSLYRLRIEFREEQELQQIEEFEFGFRALGTTGANLIYGNRRWVLRGVGSAEPPREQLPAWRDAPAVLLLDDPTPELCAEASRTGVVLVARLSVDPIEWVDRLRQLARFPAVFAVILPQTERAVDAKRVRGAAGNMLLGQAFPADQPVHPPGWADLLMCDFQTAEAFAKAVQGCPIPVVARQILPHPLPLGVARGDCDRLQRELAPYGDFAGYIVELPGGAQAEIDAAGDAPPEEAS